MKIIYFEKLCIILKRPQQEKKLQKNIQRHPGSKENRQGVQ